MKTGKIVLKIMGIFLLFALTIGSIAATVYVMERGFFISSEEKIQKETLSGIIFSEGYGIYSAYVEGQEDLISEYCEGTNLSVKIDGDYGDFSCGDTSEEDAIVYYRDQEDYGYYSGSGEEVKNFNMTLYVDKNFPEQDEYAYYNALIKFFYTFRYVICIVAGITSLLCLALFIYGILSLRHPVRWILKKGVYGIKKIVRFPVKGLKFIESRISLLWKSILLWCVVSVIALLFVSVFGFDGTFIFVGWLFGNILLFPGYVYCMWNLRTLEKAGIALAKGDLSYKVDTKHLFWDFKKSGENLNSISQGMNKAILERMKSEHFKTELITNVGHDLKTPLTSIINYADLIGKEETENENITEYANVLYNQSERLKKLIEDLIQVSKASAGILEVELEPCELDVLFTQIVGEYEQKLKEKNLELIVKEPEKLLQISVDGKMIWRVFDNLMNNAYKYAQPGTRVYLNLEEKADKAVISIKNTSKDSLNISEEELMERFIRGDNSRHSDGNGLGLSIARSLVELQGGIMDLTIDGDLFKVVLSFALQSKD